MLKNFIKNWKKCDLLDAKLEEIREVNEQIDYYKNNERLAKRGLHKSTYLEKKKKELLKQYEEIRKCM